MRISSPRRLVLVLCVAVSAAVSGGWSTATEPTGQAYFLQFDDAANELIARMTLAEKIGQMTQAELSELRGYEEIATLGLGSILSGGDSDPEAGNSADAWTAIYDRCQAAAKTTRLGIPILYGIDAVHGHNNVEGAVVFPHNIGLGCADDVDLVERISEITAREVRATGPQWAFAPCVTVPRDDRWGRTYEGFSESPDRVARLGAAAVRGLQGPDLGSPQAVLACAKHFVGDGGTTGEVRFSNFHQAEVMSWDQGDTRVDEATLREVHVAPYLPCLAEGVGSIMPSYSSWNGVKCTGSRELLTDLLKDELGFEGFLISDYNAIDQCHPDYKTAVGIAINAGIDMAMAPNGFREYITCLTELVEEGEVPMERIDDAVRRVLRVKLAMGLMDEHAGEPARDELRAEFGSDERRLVAREAVQKSLVVLTNRGATLPLRDGVDRLHVVGAAADDLGKQCGGWTIDWQGKLGEVTTGGTTLIDGFEAVGAAAGVDVSHSDDADTLPADADAIVVVVGEPPYAEGMGDVVDPTLTDEQRQLVQQAAAGDAPVVLVLLSGRPLALDEATLAAADAIVAAWLPGTEGAGVADVLLGRVEPSGTLGFTWPATSDQHPINVGDEDYEPLFPYGHGLRYSDSRLGRAVSHGTSER